MCILYFLLVKKCQNLLFCYVWVCTLGNPQFVVVFSRFGVTRSIRAMFPQNCAIYDPYPVESPRVRCPQGLEFCCFAIVFKVLTWGVIDGTKYLISRSTESGNPELANENV